MRRDFAARNRTSDGRPVALAFKGLRSKAVAEEIARRVCSITANAAQTLVGSVTHDMLNARLAFHGKTIWTLRPTNPDADLR